MGNPLIGVLLPLLLLTAALLNWSLISLIFLLTFLIIQYTPSKGSVRQYFVLWCITLFSILAILSQTAFHIIWAIKGVEWSAPYVWWAELIGIVREESIRCSPLHICSFVVQLLVVFVSLLGIYGYRSNLNQWKLFWWDHFSPSIERLGSHVRVVCCLLLPMVQLIVGISQPSFISLPFFICSCVGLVDWSLTSNFSGLFRWWRVLLVYAGMNIVLLYIYQLPVQFPHIVLMMADSMGLFKVSAVMEWPHICSGLSLLLFYIMLSGVSCDLEEMEFMVSLENHNLTEQLLPLKYSFFVRELRSGIWHTNVLLWGANFRTFSINFFTYGFPVSLLALSCWSLYFTSIFAFGLLAYVGYILCSLPSFLHWHRLNGSLLVFILFWGFSTYVFYMMVPFLFKQSKRDTEIWETIGFWHYPIPGLFLLAQFCLGVLVALGNLVSNSVLFYHTNQNNGSSFGDDYKVEEEEGTKVLIIATIAWGLRKSSRAITLMLIFRIAMKPGLIHAFYMVFFLIFLLSHSVGRKVLQSLVLLCEAHYALLYILRLDLVSKALEIEGSLTMELLSQFGFRDHASSWEHLEISVLLCFSAVQNHGFDMLFSFSAIVQHTPYPPFGIGILKAGLNKSVLLSVYGSSKIRKNRFDKSTSETRITVYLNVIEETILSAYCLCGTYVAFLTILIMVYPMNPSYISFGYLFFLLLWISGRQVMQKTRRCFWVPLKIYAVTVFVFLYNLSIFTSFQTWLSGMINLYLNLGYDPQASSLQNVLKPLSIVIVMQLHSYERRQSKYTISEELDSSKPVMVAFMRRLVILHSDKILSLALFYASLSPVSAFGFVYLLGVIICSALPKSSRGPSKLFLFYTEVLIILEYLYQMWGSDVEMFPGQRHASISLILGFQLFTPGFWGMELGLRGKIMVIFACILQDTAFLWLEMIPNALVNRGKWEEPCQLFMPAADSLHTTSIYTDRSKPSEASNLQKRIDITCKSWPYFGSNMSEGSDPASNATSGSESGRTSYCFEHVVGSSGVNHKWNKKSILSLRKERLDMQKTAIKTYLKFWIENMFRLFGLEINMIALLLVSFALLNAISLLYIALIASCILLGRRLLRKLWLIFVITFASILLLEYIFLWRNQSFWNQQSSETKMCCKECWRTSDLPLNFCTTCWLGLLIDDPWMLLSYYAVFMLACFKLRADHLTGFSESHTYHKMMSLPRVKLFWRDISFETKNLWTVFDYLRLYFYRHLLDIVLSLVLITGTFEYDILHIGYLGFALAFFRIRRQILKKKNKIFKFLRMYNFSIIVLSLSYQSPFLGNISDGECEKFGYVYKIIGFYKYDHGLETTSRYALVEIIIFVLVSLQSHMFASKDFSHVYKYLEAEQISAIFCEQEKKAAWKTTELLHIHKSLELRHQRNLQVEKMKLEMLNLQTQLQSIKPLVSWGGTSYENKGLGRKRLSSVDFDEGIILSEKEDISPKNQGTDSLSTSEMHVSPRSTKGSSPSSVEHVRHAFSSLSEITELIERASNEETLDSDRYEKRRRKHKENPPLVSAAQLIGDGVSQVDSIRNLAGADLVSFLNLSHEDLDLNEQSVSEVGVHGDTDSKKRTYEDLNPMPSVHSNRGSPVSDSANLLRIFGYIWAQMRSNNDVVCYCCFVLIFLSNFSVLSMVYLAALFFYSLCVYTGPSNIFWVIVLVYTEFYILLQYLYQIIIHHYNPDFHWELLHEIGFPRHKIKTSFAISSWPLFLLYLFVLLQNSIVVADSDWDSLTQLNSLKRRHLYEERIVASSSWVEMICQVLLPAINLTKMLLRSFTWYWKALTRGAESPPHFLQLSMDVKLWPKDGIQPERIESGINELLSIGYDEEGQERNPSLSSSACQVRVQSIKKNQENPDLVLVVLEVVHALPLPESIRTEWFFKSLTPAGDVANKIRRAQRAGLDAEIGFPYPIISVIGGGRRHIDLYAYTFGADLAVFFFVAIFYHSIVKNSSQLLELDQLEDQFPLEFMFILMILFFLIVLDRIIYLCSFATGKVILYFFNLVLFTYSVTKYAWYMNPSHKYAGPLAIRVIYLTKAISLALQAIQIRYGIPHKSALYRHFLTRKVSRINILSFQFYRLVPFLHELRCLLDWSCTTTSLKMYDWLKLEDIHSSLYLVKCDVDLNRSKHQHGQKQTKMTKFCSGICLFLIMICLIWAPTLMYSSGNPTNIANPIKDASVQIDIKTASGKLNLYQTTLCEIFSWRDLHVDATLDPKGYLRAYDVDDIQLICCQSDASTLWIVPPPVQARFVQSIDQDMSLTFSWILSRDRPKGKEVVKYEIFANPPPNPSEVQAVFSGATNNFRIYDFYMKYFRVTGPGDVRLLEQMVDSVSGDLMLNRGNTELWSFHDMNASDVCSCAGLTGPMAIVVSDETPQGIFGETLSKFSIWGLYLTFVLAVGRFIRLHCSKLRRRIPFENFPSCDRLLALCEDIYAARAEGELEVEEVLYWTLIKIYRTPHMLLEYTKLE